MSAKKKTANSELGKTKPKVAFIVTPIGGDSSPTRRETDGLIDCVLEPVLQEMGFELRVAHRISTPGSISTQVILDVIQSDIVIANLTELNPNVMYELAIRHSFGKKVIVLAKQGTKLPFDVQDERTIFYENDLRGATQLKEDLIRTLEEVESTEVVDNPVKRAHAFAQFWEQVDSSDDPMLRFVVSGLKEVQRSVSSMAATTQSGRSRMTARLVGTKWEVQGMGVIHFLSDQEVVLMSSGNRKGWIAIDENTIVWGDNYRFSTFSSDFQTFSSRDLRGKDRLTAKRM